MDFLKRGGIWVELMTSLKLHVWKFLHVSAFSSQIPVYPATSLGVCNARDMIEFSCVRQYVLQLGSWPAS